MRTLIVVIQSCVDFFRIYSLQEKGQTFTTVEELLCAMNPKFINNTAESTFEGLKQDGFSLRTIDELVMATLRTNYGQTTSVPKFVGEFLRILKIIMCNKLNQVKQMYPNYNNLY